MIEGITGLQVQTSLLILMRISAFFMISPGFSMKGLPNLVKIGLSAGLTLAAYPVTQALSAQVTMQVFAVLAIKEVLLGLAIGFITKLIFSAIEMAGNFVDFQVGFQMGAVFDPALGVSSSYYGKIYYWMSICIFFITDLHHLVLKTVIKTFQSVPIESTNLGGFGVEGMVKLYSIVFESAINLAAPLMIVALFTEVVLGLISRTVPQINVLILGMPLKIIASFIFILLLLPAISSNIQDILPMMTKYINEFIQSLPKA
ncbi:flagellar biosynthetic protein FliR [Carnobacterium sp.]|uniref:flagellar biosynthetic protein FliR n=1 Tax=Carnobacterium sp. TaxID=48221 RepID=UPI003C7213E3